LKVQESTDLNVTFLEGSDNNGQFLGWSSSIAYNNKSAEEYCVRAPKNNDDGYIILDSQNCKSKDPDNLGDDRKLRPEWGYQLVGDPVTCPSTQVLSYLRREGGVMQYRCASVGGLGACISQTSPSVNIDSGTSFAKLASQLNGTCKSGYALQSLVAQQQQDSLSYYYTCCFVGAPPTTVTPSGERQTQALEVRHGVYCPVNRDRTGRLQFEQRSTFKAGAAPNSSYTLAFDNNTGAWCVSAGSVQCIMSDLADPLDDPLQSSEFEVVKVTDFDGNFKETSDPTQDGPGNRKFPTLIQFKATRPQYAEECQDDVTPGATGFSLDKMNKVGLSLSMDNPCYYAAGKAPPQPGKKLTKGVSFKNPFTWSKLLTSMVATTGEGKSSWFGNDFQHVFTGGAGATAGAVWDCWERQSSRNSILGAAVNTQTALNWIFSKASRKANSVCDLFPGDVTAPLGVGTYIDLTSKCQAGVKNIFGPLKALNTALMGGEKAYKSVADSHDCDGVRIALSRIMCDLHCVRNVVVQGNNAVLDSLEGAVNVLDNNTKLMLDYYTGLILDQLNTEGSETALAEQSSRTGDAALLEHGMNTIHSLWREIHEMAHQHDYDPMGVAMLQRALSGFTGGLSGAPLPAAAAASTGNPHAPLTLLREHSARLHATFQAASSRRLSVSSHVERRAAQYATAMRQLLHSQNRLLGSYRHSAGEAAKRQRRLGHRAAELRLSDLADELQRHEVRSLLLELDEGWWELRATVDGYLLAAQEQAHAYGSAVSLLDGYTARCSASLAELKASYRRAAAADRRHDAALRDAWSRLAPQLGLLAARIVDGDALEQLLHTDAAALGTEALTPEARDRVCGPDAAAAAAAVEPALRRAAAEGLAGQTVQQLHAAFLEAALLEDRHAFSGLGQVPEADAVREAWAKLGAAHEASTAAIPALAAAAVPTLRGQLNC